MDVATLLLTILATVNPAPAALDVAPAPPPPSPRYAHTIVNDEDPEAAAREWLAVLSREQLEEYALASALGDLQRLRRKRRGELEMSAETESDSWCAPTHHATAPASPPAHAPARQPEPPATPPAPSPLTPGESAGAGTCEAIGEVQLSEIDVMSTLECMEDDARERVLVYAASRWPVAGEVVVRCDPMPSAEAMAEAVLERVRRGVMT
jgi:hypothetical protein